MPSKITATAPHPRDPALDGLRGLAVLLIFLYHYGGGLTSTHFAIRLFGMLTASGWVGVQIFFALSGFLITGILWNTQTHQHSPHRIRNFFARRALRILPLFYAALVVVCAVTTARSGSIGSLRPLWPEFLFLQDIPVFATHAQKAAAVPIYHFWSLAVEEQFYLLWPFALLLCRTRRAALTMCAAVFVISVAFCVVLYSPAHWISPTVAESFNEFLLTNAGGLAAGSCIALAGSSRVNRFAAPLFVAGLATFLFSSLRGGSFSLAHPHQMFLALPGIWIAAACLICILLRPGTARRIFSSPALGFIGRISYGVYVFHILLEPAYSALARGITRAHSGYFYLGTRLMIAFPLTLVVAWASFRFFEAPLLRCKRYFAMRAPA